MVRIFSAVAGLKYSTASASACQEGGGLICFSHVRNISRKQSLAFLQSCSILSSISKSVTRSTPRFFHSEASDKLILKAEGKVREAAIADGLVSSGSHRGVGSSQ